MRADKEGMAQLGGGRGGGGIEKTMQECALTVKEDLSILVLYQRLRKRTMKKREDERRADTRDRGTLKNQGAQMYATEGSKKDSRNLL